jgi:AraC-like DNA-binding protein
MLIGVAPFSALRFFSTCGAIVLCLDDRKRHVSKIAWLLGFYEVSAFTNAFKRWTGSRTTGA